MDFSSQEQYLELVKSKIASDGWTVQYVGGRKADYRGNHIIESFGYSVGLTAYEQPEIIVVGRFEPSLIASVINSAIRNAKLHDEVYVDRYVGERVLQNFPVIFRGVTDDCAMHTAFVAKRLYGRVHLLQMFLPDENGRFPWHSDCEDGFNEQASLQYVSPPPGLH